MLFLESGSALNHWAYDPNPRRAAVNLSNYLKCRTTSKDPNKITSQEMLACFDKLSNDELVKAQFEFSPVTQYICIIPIFNSCS